MAENKLADMSTEFAVKILNLTDGIKGHYSLANQLERSGTSISPSFQVHGVCETNPFSVHQWTFPASAWQTSFQSIERTKRLASYFPRPLAPRTPLE